MFGTSSLLRIAARCSLNWERLHSFTPVAPNGENRSRDVLPKKKKKKYVLRLKKRGRKTTHGSVAAMAIKSVLSSGGPKWASEVLREVRELRPNVNPVNVYAALHSAAADGKLNKEMVGTKARYSRPNA
jgi:hypothetical protein